MTRWLGLAAVLLAAVLVWSPGSTAAGESGERAARGEALYQANCAACHGADATGMGGMTPALGGVVDRLTVEGVEVTIRRGRDTRPPMPAFGDQLEAGEIADLVAYLETLPPGPRNLGPEGRGPMGGMGGMGGMMGGGPGPWWLLVVVLVAALAGTVGYLAGQRRP